MLAQETLHYLACQTGERNKRQGQKNISIVKDYGVTITPVESKV
jgi:hypothetical protein